MAFNQTWKTQNERKGHRYNDKDHSTNDRTNQIRVRLDKIALKGITNASLKYDLREKAEQ